MHICRQELVAYQRIHLEGIEKLTALNPQARSLRTKRRAAEIKYKIAKKSKNPKFIVAAWAYLKSVILEQKAFAIIQNSIKTSTAARAQLHLRRAQHKINRLHYIHYPPLNQGAFKPALKKLPRKSMTPDYVLRSRFERKQNMQLFWQITLLKKFNKKTFSDINLSCSATINTQEEPWKVVLSHADKL